MPLILLLVMVSLLCLTLQIPSLSSLTEWQVSAISQGQWLRILSGNFTHTNYAHLWMNLAALWIIAFIFRPSAISYAVLLVLISLIVGISLTFTPLLGYVGLSGTLHGLFAYYALTEALNGRKSSWLLVVGVITKVLWEQAFGASLSTINMIEAPVAIDAHLFGVVGGLLLAVLSLTLKKNTA